MFYDFNFNHYSAKSRSTGTALYDNDNDLFRLGCLLGLYVDLYVSDSCLMKKHASTAPPQIQYYILHLLNGCSTINSTTVRLLGLLSDVS